MLPPHIENHAISYARRDAISIKKTASATFDRFLSTYRRRGLDAVIPRYASLVGVVASGEGVVCCRDIGGHRNFPEQSRIAVVVVQRIPSSCRRWRRDLRRRIGHDVGKHEVAKSQTGWLDNDA